MILIVLETVLLRALREHGAATLGGFCANADQIAGAVRPIAEAMLARDRASDARLPWLGYLALRPRDAAVVGTCSFKGPPRAGAVEIAYRTFRPYEGQGVATAMVSELIRLAFAQRRVDRVVARTRPEAGAATRILQRHGFRLAEAIEAEDGRVWQWARRSDGTGGGKP